MIRNDFLKQDKSVYESSFAEGTDDYALVFDVWRIGLRSVFLKKHDFFVIKYKKIK